MKSNIALFLIISILFISISNALNCQKKEDCIESNCVKLADGGLNFCLLSSKLGLPCSTKVDENGVYVNGLPPCGGSLKCIENETGKGKCEDLLVFDGN
ncbi:hypothetical protein DICPUDRAFT_154621 [Dictyostelium purpureum]|uniref:Uncharacterized protein n=1 Tax=Dictyostelium purpureum TaxID=5786 RepID=F0ZRT7_DICPU|nr:uncharacterized protein DICPUDRAFT_154621 [Dictyostelium purpureum]EGC33343.1 hypothetical protein DICPUDRAFT_154621 [Dictyostelium purpureum]|eukprot:XP_003290128.1 hypothetical protein DICPUDRAFT_154621 [Dictyostelium purpureum]